MFMGAVMTKLGGRYGIATAFCLLITFSLSSCFMADPEGATNPPTISREGESLVIAVCTDSVVTDVRIEARGFPVNWKELYIATGRTDVHVGDTFATDSSLPGLTATVSVAPDFDQMTEYMVVLTDSYSDSLVSKAGFSVPGTGIPVGEWLHWDGSVTKDPCPG